MKVGDLIIWTGPNGAPVALRSSAILIIDKDACNYICTQGDVKHCVSIEFLEKYFKVLIDNI